GKAVDVPLHFRDQGLAGFLHERFVFVLFQRVAVPLQQLDAAGHFFDPRMALRKIDEIAHEKPVEQRADEGGDQNGAGIPDFLHLMEHESHDRFLFLKCRAASRRKAAAAARETQSPTVSKWGQMMLMSPSVNQMPCFSHSQTGSSMAAYLAAS